MDRLEVRAEVRAHEPAFRRRLVAAWRRAFERAARRVKSSKGKRGRVEFRAIPKYESFRLPEDHPAVREAMSAVRAAGLDPHAGLAIGGLDANWMTARGIPTVTMGAGLHNPHQFGEHLDVGEYLAACRVALVLATGG
jgi:tripeptide aminopeptidase